MKTIELTRGLVAIVDDEDFERLAQYRWYASRPGYAMRGKYDPATGKRRTVFMHHEILPAVPGFVTDHKNGNKLDNRRENLRHCTHSENIRNSKTRTDSRTGVKGVRSHYGRFWARITMPGGKRISLGMFDTAEQAKAAYDAAAVLHHGNLARLN